MRALWEGQVKQPFVVRAILPVTPELAYTTLMTTLNRLGDKGLLAVQRSGGHRAHQYRVARSPEDFLASGSIQQVTDMVDRYGDAALAAFAAKLAELTPAQRERLRRIAADS